MDENEIINKHDDALFANLKRRSNPIADSLHYIQLTKGQYRRKTCSGTLPEFCAAKHRCI
jgi:hypothetical protein